MINSNETNKFIFIPSILLNSNCEQKKNNKKEEEEIYIFEY
jgi:hypothetical protein